MAMIDEYNFQHQNDLMDIWRNVLPNSLNNKSAEKSNNFFETKIEQNFFNKIKNEKNKNFYFSNELKNETNSELINLNYVLKSNVNNNNNTKQQQQKRLDNKSDSNCSTNYLNFQEHLFGEFGASTAAATASSVVSNLLASQKTNNNVNNNNNNINNFYSNSCWSPISNDDNSPLFSSWNNVYDWINSTNPQVNFQLIN